MQHDSAQTRALERSATPPSEHLVNIMKAALGTAPFTGGLASLMSDYIPSTRLKRLEDFATLIGEDLAALQNSIDAEYMRTDHFAYVLESCFRGAADNYQREKRAAFRGILINTALHTPLDDAEREYFLGLVNKLTPLHMRILKFLDTPSRFMTDQGMTVEQLRGGFAQMFLSAMPTVSTDVVVSAFGELYDSGLLNTNRSAFTTMTAGSGIALLEGRISDLGKQFCSFCRSPLDK